MKIAIDISQVVYGTGVSTYTKNLVKSLLLNDDPNDYLLFAGTLRRRNDLEAFTKSLKGNYKTKFVPFPPTIMSAIWNKLHILPIERFVGKVDVFHSSDWTQPPSRAYKITTVHDLIPLKFPDLSHPKIVSTFKSRLNWVEKEVDSVIVPSKSTKLDLVNFGVSEERVSVIPEAPDPIFMPKKKSEIHKVTKKYDIKGKYILAVGITPRKNNNRIIRAFRDIKAKYNLRLVIIGYPYIKIKPENGIILTGAVPAADLPSLYSGAEVLVYPSLYEGFGLPILEAFSTKTPVVTSNRGSLLETAKDAAVLVNPKKTGEIKDGIIHAIENREIFIQKGVKRVKTFSWNNIARKTLQIYAKARRR